MSEFQEKIAGCYLNNRGGDGDNTLLGLYERLDVIFDRIHFYGDTLTMQGDSSTQWTDCSLETLGTILMDESRAAKLVIEKYWKENSHN